MSAPSIVLLPGLDGTGTLFADLVSDLPPTPTVIVSKYPAERFLSYDELIVYVREIVPRQSPFVIVAESSSTPLAAKYAATRPPNLVGMVLCAGFVTNPAGNWTLLAKLLTRGMVFRISPPRWFLKHFVIGSNPPPRLEVSFRKALRMANPEVLAERLRAVLNCDERESLARTEIPVMYIQAELDRLVPTKCFREIQRIRPDTLLVPIREAPHLVLQRESRKCAVAIGQFIHGLRR